MSAPEVAVTEMEYRALGRSGLMVPVLSLGTGTFGGGTDFFRAWGTVDVKEATRLVDIALDAGVSMFDSADTYSKGLAEEVLGHDVSDTTSGYGSGFDLPTLNSAVQSLDYGPKIEKHLRAMVSAAATRQRR